MSDDDKTRLTPDEAKARFGELLHRPTRTHMEFDDPDGRGIWRPQFNVDKTLRDYRLYRPVRATKVRPAWRPKGKA